MIPDPLAGVAATSPSTGRTFHRLARSGQRLACDRQHCELTKGFCFSTRCVVICVQRWKTSLSLHTSLLHIHSRSAGPEQVSPRSLWGFCCVSPGSPFPALCPAKYNGSFVSPRSLEAVPDPTKRLWVFVLWLSVLRPQAQTGSHVLPSLPPPFHGVLDLSCPSTFNLPFTSTCFSRSPAAITNGHNFVA